MIDNLRQNCTLKTLSLTFTVPKSFASKLILDNFLKGIKNNNRFLGEIFFTMKFWLWLDLSCSAGRKHVKLILNDDYAVLNSSVFFYE